MPPGNIEENPSNILTNLTLTLFGNIPQYLEHRYLGTKSEV